jgi:hypothetical protein
VGRGARGSTGTGAPYGYPSPTTTTLARWAPSQAKFHRGRPPSVLALARASSTVLRSGCCWPPSSRRFVGLVAAYPAEERPPSRRRVAPRTTRQSPRGSCRSVATTPCRGRRSPKTRFSPTAAASMSSRSCAAIGSHQWPALQPREASRELAIDALLAQVGPEYGEAAATRQARVAAGDADARRVRTPNLLSEVKVPVAALAAHTARGVPCLLQTAERRGSVRHLGAKRAGFQPELRSVPLR